MKQISRWMMAAVLMVLLGSCSGEDGMLKISSEPADAEIYIDGDRKGNTPSEKGQTFAIKISAGEHKIEIIKPIENPDKYDQYYGEKSVVVAEKSLQTVSLSLEKRQSEDYKEQLAEEAEKFAKAAKEALSKVESTMVMIPSGSFMMGSNDGGSDEKPVHRVHINSFKMGKYEVTQALWQAVMGSNPSRFKGANRPVEKVSWDDIQAFIRKLNRRTGKHFRLPSEAEWEYAARAGTTTAFSTGNCIHTSQANYDGNYDYNHCGAKTGVYRQKTLAVGSFIPNKFGLYDMHGNVWEWVEDCYHGSYSGAPSDGSAWTSGSCGRRVLRGGSCSNNPLYMRSAYRLWHSPDLRTSDNGFRLVQD